MDNPHSDRAWFLVLPALALMGIVALIPLIAVLNFSFHDIFTVDQAYWIGLEWYQDILRSSAFWASLGRSALFTLIALSVQIPLGIWIALLLLRMSRLAVPILMLVALPLVVPWNMIAGMWLTLINPELGLVGQAIKALDLTFDYKFTPVHTWVLIVLADTWHWIGLVIILGYAGLAAIPAPFRQAAEIDGATRFAVFRYIELPRITGALSVVLLLRIIDSLMIYTEPFAINAGGPNNATTFLSLELAADIGSYTYGRAAARAMLDFLIVLTIAWAFIRIRSTGQTEAQRAGAAP